MAKGGSVLSIMSISLRNLDYFLVLKKELTVFHATSGAEGVYAFTANDRLEDDDLWGCVAVDAANRKVYFQCTEVSVDGQGSEQMRLPLKDTRHRIHFNRHVDQPGRRRVDNYPVLYAATGYHQGLGRY